MAEDVRCAICRERITKESDLCSGDDGKPVHRTCFVCDRCGVALSRGNCGRDRAGVLLCRAHLPADLKTTLEKSLPRTGHMFKQGARFGFQGWQQRFFALFPEEMKLAYYKTQNDFYSGNKKGVIDLNLVSNTAKALLQVEGKGSLPSLQLVTSNRMWNLACESEADRDKWLEVVNEYIQKAKSKSKSK